MTQAWVVLQKSWKGFKIAKGQDDVKRMKYCADGIRKAQKELGLKVDSFGLYASDVPLVQGSEMDSEKAHKTEYDYSACESEAQRIWRERMEESDY